MYCVNFPCFNLKYPVVRFVLDVIAASKLQLQFQGVRFGQLVHVVQTQPVFAINVPESGRVLVMVTVEVHLTIEPSEGLIDRSSTYYVVVRLVGWLYCMASYSQGILGSVHCYCLNGLERVAACETSMAYRCSTVQPPPSVVMSQNTCAIVPPSMTV